MPPVNHQEARDVAIYRAWVDGARQDDLAAQYGVQQPAISKALDRVQSALPPVEKDREVRRAVELCDGMLGVYVPQARASNTAASREARGWLSLKAKWLGIDRREVQVQGQVEHYWSPGPTVQELLDQWRDQGKVQVEARRLDQ